MFITVIIGVLTGVSVAQRPTSLSSAFFTIFSLFGFAMPSFWLGIMLILAFSLYLPLFPSYGMITAGSAGNFWQFLKDILHHLVLPASTLGIILIGPYSRLSRTSMLEVIGSDYIRTARAKGLPKRRVIFKHALRNAILPILTMVGLQLAGNGAFDVRGNPPKGLSAHYGDSVFLFCCGHPGQPDHGCHV